MIIIIILLLIIIIIVACANALSRGTYRAPRPDAVGSDETPLHPVSITRFPLTRFSPGSGLLRNPFVHR